jgi:predicted DsbA family dithiol-disulfide isomerase
LRSFWAAEAARRQGEDAFWRFHQALLYARHVQGRDLADRQTQREVARQVELNLDQFERDWHDRSLLDRLKADHTRAVSESNIFGTPSFVFPGVEAVYLKLAKVPEGEEALSFWQTFYQVAAQMPWVVEMKRPR